MKTTKPSVEQTVMNILSGHPDATTAELATAGELGRSTVSKTLAKLESAGKARRSKGGRDSSRRLPDRWRLASSRAHRARQPAGDRLRPGQLDGLVLACARLLSRRRGSARGPAVSTASAPASVMNQFESVPGVCTRSFDLIR